MRTPDGRLKSGSKKRCLRPGKSSKASNVSWQGPLVISGDGDGQGRLQADVQHPLAPVGDTQKLLLGKAGGYKLETQGQGGGMQA